MKLGNVKVNFRHNLKKRKTQCTLTTEGGVTHVATATCCREDFDKLKQQERFPNTFKSHGRKIAMKRALEASDLTKEERYDVWDDYRNLPASPRW